VARALRTFNTDVTVCLHVLALSSMLGLWAIKKPNKPVVWGVADSESVVGAKT
jgi:hypothetical protein